ncbi:gamma-glutamylcyclotransferase [soil metagenome]|nr:gamma-glutamylcyclotransferase [Trueperaceae bacterium]
MRYFAYGSNLDPRQMATRCPTSSFLARALLRAHALAFTRWSPRRSCGVADIVPRADADVWGVVYELSAAEAKGLDGYEGYVHARSTNGYRRTTKTVYADGDIDAPLEVMTYEVCTPSVDPLRPSAAYLQHILDGAAHWALPAAYQRALSEIRVSDPA